MKHILVAAITAIATTSATVQAQDYCNCLPMPIDEIELHLSSVVSWSAGIARSDNAENVGVPVRVEHTACGSHAHQNLIGQPLQVAYDVGAAQNARILRPGQITNMLYIADRMNISILENEVIERVYCG